MITKESAKRELSRLSEYDGWHRLTREAMEDMICAVQVAETDAIAKRVIDDLKSDELRESVPTSTQIRQGMYAENARQRPRPMQEHHRPTLDEMRNALHSSDASEQRHLELLEIRMQEIRGQRWPYPETDTVREMHEIHRKWGMR